MSHYIGGSAPAMVRQISEGFTLVTAVSLKRFSVEELRTLQFELEKLLREIRGEQVDLQDIPGLQKRNRKISRVDGSLRVIRSTLQSRRRKA